MTDDDDTPREPPPIRGAPRDAPRPPFPTGVADSEHVQRVDMLPGPNEIASRIEALKIEERRGARIALESRLQIARLLVIMHDHHAYRGSRYEEFAQAHGIKKTDSHGLYLVGTVAGDVMQKCEAEAKLNPHNYEWPHWRKVLRDIKKSLTSGGDDGEAEGDDAEDAEEEPAEVDPMAELVRERDNLKAQVAAITQQHRNERARREEIEEQLNHAEAGFHDELEVVQERHDRLLETAGMLRQQLDEREQAFRELAAAHAGLMAEAALLRDQLMDHPAQSTALVPVTPREAPADPAPRKRRGRPPKTKPQPK
jgi:hypothetical protein